MTKIRQLLEQLAQEELCDYPLARNLVMLAVAVTCEAIVEF